ncbi:MAG: SIMPL domain-containing protein, partial [Gemmatimonadaceae bacterium]
AVADARANADAMARGVGGTLGGLVDLSTSYAPFGGVTSYVSTTSYEGSPFAGIATPPVVRDLTVVATVTARWEIVMPPARVP